MAQLTKERNRTIADSWAEAEARYRAANPTSLARHERACRFMPGGNTRAVMYYSPFPLGFRRGEGAHLWDLDGHRLVDFVAEQSAGLYGHTDRTIRKAIDTALDDGINLGGPNVYEAELAEAVCSRFPSIELVRFTNSGTEGNLMALVTARAFTGRNKILAFHGGYHGGVFSFAKGPASTNAPFAVVMADYNDIDGTLKVIERERADLAAVILEPMMGGGGCIAADAAFLKALREACDRHGILLVFDEVMTSRLGPGGVQERIGVRPDLTSLGKYVGGGMSFGAFGGRRDVMIRYDPSRADYYHHAGTFNNNVCTMAAGVAGLRDVYTPDAAIRMNAAGDGLRDATHRGRPIARRAGAGHRHRLADEHPLRAAPDPAAGGRDEGQHRGAQPAAPRDDPSRLLHRAARVRRAVAADHRDRYERPGRCLRGVPR